MTTGPALAGPRCRRVLEPEAGRDGTGRTCRRCLTEFALGPFPALTAAWFRRAPQAAVVAVDSVFFFRPTTGRRRAARTADGGWVRGVP